MFVAERSTKWFERNGKNLNQNKWWGNKVGLYILSVISIPDPDIHVYAKIFTQQNGRVFSNLIIENYGKSWRLSIITEKIEYLIYK